MIRPYIKEKLDNSIIFLYESVYHRPVFPIEPLFACFQLECCRYISYTKLAKINNVSVFDIIRACNSSDGCTHFDVKNNRYLIAANDTINNKARKRWTISHELGHIFAGHFIEILSSNECADSTMEDEANYFAANFLAPSTAIRHLNAKSSSDIQDWFGMSRIASENRFAEYLTQYSPVIEQYFRRVPAKSVIKRQNILGKPVDIWSD